MPQFNQQFGRTAAKRADVHRRLPDERVLRVLSLQEQRVVQPDWTVRWHNGFLQLPPATAQHLQPGTKVMVSQQLDGHLRIFAGDRELPWSPVRDTASRPARRSSPTCGPTGSTQGQKPRANHPGVVASSRPARPPLWGWTAPLRSLRSLRYAVQPHNKPKNTKGTFLMVYNTQRPRTCHAPLEMSP